MFGGPGLKGRIARQQFAAFAQSSRSMSSFRPQLSRLSVQNPNGKILSGSTTWRRPVPSFALPAARLNSTSSSTPTQVTPETQPSSEWDVDISQIPESIGYLKELGLDYGWGPSAMVEYIMEHIHIYSGLPWLATIVATGVLFRLAMLPLFMRSADIGAKSFNAQPMIKPIRENMLKAARSGDQVAAQKFRAEMASLNSRLGIKPMQQFLPMLFQIPVGYGCYRVINGMSTLPVPGLAKEQFAWVSDLTVSDPTFLLPIMTCVGLHLSLRKGSEDGNMNSDMGTLRKFIMYGMPAVSLLFMAWWPAALQVYFLTTGSFGLIQSYLFSSTTFRKATGIALLEKQAPAQPSGSTTPAEPNRSLRMITEMLERENAKIKEARKDLGEKEKLSFVDRAINNIKESKDKLAKETTQKMQEMSGNGPKSNSDGSPAEPPRLSDKDRKLAEDYERRRKEEEHWKREERNYAKKEAFRQAMERERQKAKEALNKSNVKR
ncbi:membrane insertase OXA1 [Aspergillus mulundensis]|uniref:Membrane insertase YidC/Oxa/ALB C-terminal domain-containing protein n=1 Tax=Aspergillus mulundensis TaxID=1810919 RepID=A0A3D8T3K7_9EURO|nr:hypothetical protein DSM5745_00455 [Aspergillus mulundensis]RDW93133.1 hypothetical protein DSM5745_00455 [Aspergillus mulundensis]